jgi:nucleotide-binding universal stress UspA family protein
MTVQVNPGWSKPSNLLFATEIPVNEKAFCYALAKAREFGAHLTILHAYDTLVVAASETSGIGYYDYEVAAQGEKEALAPLAMRAHDAGVECTMLVRPGLPTDQIIAFLRERETDCIILGTHARGAIGQLIIGSIAEAVVRTATVPVFVVGPDAVSGRFRPFATRTVLCAINEEDRSYTVAAVAANIAAQHKAKLILQHVIRPHDREATLSDRSLEQMELDLHRLVPMNLKNQLQVEAIVVPGNPADELLHQSKVQHADLIVMGAHHASMLATLTRLSVVHKVLARSHCPVLTLSSLVAEQVREHNRHRAHDGAYMAGVF